VGAWHVVSGYVDEECTLRQKALEELFEETGVTQISSIHAGEPYVHCDVKRWTVYPVTIQIPSETHVRLNEEHTEFAWIDPARMDDYLLPHVCAAFVAL
jgi:8-oxo-dGTP pyrophosphatase MutT (NUDIX family)